MTPEAYILSESKRTKNAIRVVVVLALKLFRVLPDSLPLLRTRLRICPSPLLDSRSTLNGDCVEVIQADDTEPGGAQCCLAGKLGDFLGWLRMRVNVRHDMKCCRHGMDRCSSRNRTNSHGPAKCQPFYLGRRRQICRPGW